MTRRRATLVGAGLGGTAACLALDALHVASGTTFYAEPVWPGGLAWWVPLLFAAANAAVLGTTAMIPHTDRGPLALDALLFVGAYAGSSFLGGWSEAYALALAVVWGLRVARRPAWVAAHGIALAVAGSAVEASLCATGVFGYRHPDLLGIPWWLPGIYLHASGLGVTLTARAPA